MSTTIWMHVAFAYAAISIYAYIRFTEWPDPERPLSRLVWLGLATMWPLVLVCACAMALCGFDGHDWSTSCGHCNTHFHAKAHWLLSYRAIRHLRARPDCRGSTTNLEMYRAFARRHLVPGWVSWVLSLGR